MRGTGEAPAGSIDSRGPEKASGIGSGSSFTRTEAVLGIGAAWFEREHLGLGVAFPPLKERFERLDSVLEELKEEERDDRDA